MAVFRVRHLRSLGAGRLSEGKEGGQSPEAACAPKTVRNYNYEVGCQGQMYIFDVGRQARKRRGHISIHLNVTHIHLQGNAVMAPTYFYFTHMDVM